MKKYIKLMEYEGTAENLEKFENACTDYENYLQRLHLAAGFMLGFNEELLQAHKEFMKEFEISYAN